jgi:hypothetical protein
MIKKGVWSESLYDLKTISSWCHCERPCASLYFLFLSFPFLSFFFAEKRPSNEGKLFTFCCWQYNNDLAFKAIARTLFESGYKRSCMNYLLIFLLVCSRPLCHMFGTQELSTSLSFDSGKQKLLRCYDESNGRVLNESKQRWVYV